ASLMQLLSPRALLDSLRIGLGPPRQIFERGPNALKFCIEIFVVELRQIFEGQFQNVAVGAGRDWENMIEISEQKRAAIEAHLELAAFEGRAALCPHSRGVKL